MQTKHRPDAGFSLTALIFFATAASIAIAAIVPAYQMQAKREVELELIFRGGEYTRAIQKYHAKFGVWPTSIDQLVSTNNLRFIRRAYKDPVTGKDFRLILLNPDGSLTGSKLFTQNVNNNQSMFGNGPQPFGQGQNNPQQPNNNNNNRPNGGLQNNTPGLNNNSFGNSPGQTQNGPQNNISSLNNAFGGQQNQPGQPNAAGGAGAVRVGGGVNPQPGSQGQSNGLSFTAATNINGGRNTTPGGTQVAGSGIIGVASDDDKDSIIVYNNRQKYNEWEFIAILGQPGQQNGQQQPGQNRPNPQQPGQPQNNPFSTPNQPFGGPPTGGNGAARQPGNFGFGPQPTPNPSGKLP
jgi:hypothetical protein